MTDRRDRAFPRDVDANDNPAEGTVGPNVPAGFGDTHVMYDANAPAPPQVQAWDGWPVEWATPNWGATVGLADISRRVSTVWAAIDKQAWILATMPPYLTNEDGQRLPRLDWMRNPQPEVYSGWIEAMRQVVFSFLSAGEVFLWATSYNDDATVDMPKGTVRTWTMINPGWVNVDITGQIRNRYELAGLDITGDVLHIRYASWPGDARGHGPLEAGARALFGADALERYAANLAIRGGIPWAVLSSPRPLTANQAADMRAQYVTARASALGAPAILSGGLTLQPLTINPKDMALLELRQFDEGRLAVLLGVPPHLLALPDGSGSLTYSTVEGIYDYHWRSALRPLAAGLMEAIGNWAIGDPARLLEVDRDEYVRPPLEQRAAAYATMFNIFDPATGERLLYIDEMRRKERFDANVRPPKSPPVVPQPMARASKIGGGHHPQPYDSSDGEYSGGGGGGRNAANFDRVVEGHPNVDVVMHQARHAAQPTYVIDRITVAPDLRGSGLANAAMRDIVQHADRHGYYLALTPEQTGAGAGRMTTAQLREWYGRFGFKPNRGRYPDISESMVREP